ncbi:MAG: acetate kinase [Halanaerobium sp. 4-GBenrich]|uniref:Acetate kinase n=1 Tax=Halanaerobium congolense TaxID=54121 RepID=A0A1M7MZ03_9FIRM|nr:MULTISPECIES: acetate kinase [Halanaerobium]KXS49382.1 MAG: acetate kinase [Halanaerobium sp. T82-1]ODS50205.1 MAG: acetate kinase [Halanaerobium sp. 4-GBenrich]OEG63709.1 MAG: acetate kinase [Halanaerobium sp. MDAL1]PTX16080.1 acetate kinase [Halanaerobium congolense]PUU95124.1 MAG: acetate kinase [Halanaerobium sp.]
MKIFVINCGSSSLKYKLFDMRDEDVLAEGIIERIGIENSFLKYETKEGTDIKIEHEIPTHKEGIELLIETLLSDEHGVLEDMDEIKAVGHRVAHGGEKFAHSTLIDDEVMKEIEDISDLAPLHNPANLMGIEVCKELMPETSQVAVFDTAFHQTMPEEAYTYALPYEYYEKYGVRRYGFHGTSHGYVANRAAEMMDEDINDLKIVTCHLGNGASIAAVKNGESIDTSMGFTPLEGLVMGTRCGDIDPAIVPFIMDKEDMTTSEIDSVLNKESGLYGVSGVSSDMRDIEGAADEGNNQAQVALDIFNYRVKKYIGSYSAAMGGVDAVVFTAGIGENAIETREEILAGLEYMGIKIDKNANDIRGKEQIITTSDSTVKAMVIPTNEELVIAKDTKAIVS